MTFFWIAARIFVVVAILTTAFFLLPPASVYDSTALSIPDVAWNPIVAVLHLGRALPIATLLVLAGFEVSIAVGMMGLWLYSWLIRHLLGGS
jgi:hypothetical protein